MLYSNRIVVFSPQQTYYSGYRELFLLYGDFLDDGVTNHMRICASVIVVCSKVQLNGFVYYCFMYKLV